MNTLRNLIQNNPIYGDIRIYSPTGEHFEYLKKDRSTRFPLWSDDVNPDDLDYLVSGIVATSDGVLEIHLKYLEEE